MTTSWHAKEAVRALHFHTDPALALGQDVQDNDCPPEIRRLGRTLIRGRHRMASPVLSMCQAATTML